MKKILPYTLIVLIFVQLFAPFAVDVNKNKIDIHKNTASASKEQYVFNIKPLTNPLTTDRSVRIYLSVDADIVDDKGGDLSDNILNVRVTLKDKSNAIVPIEKNPQEDRLRRLDHAFVPVFEGLDPGTEYYLVIEVTENGSVIDVIEPGKLVKTSATDTQEFIDQGEVEGLKESEDVSGLPVCSLNPWSKSGSFSGCFAQLFYYVLFVPTSYLFALAGTFFDFTFHYSIQDGSYRTPFVVEGWGIVRDFCNMFFIFILLYIAFGTILKLHSVKTKEMIINVIIIGLLINFSLFATQVIVDASNILARVFYNSNTIRITQGDGAKNGIANATPGLKIGPNGEIPLSAAIVNKVNPQNLIINGRKAVVIEDKVTGEEGNSETEGNLGVGAFILITFLATAVNVVGIITFLSIGLIFVARVIGLWLAMILAPLAFFSYTVPALKKMEMIGWERWWPETLKLAFLAPIFIFFMYLIIAFLEKGLSLIKTSEATDGLTFVISIIIPFVFIMILLMKAKDIAKTMSGTMGQSITNGVAAVGGVALGAGIGGLALAGRASIGRLANKANTSGWLNDAAAGKKGKFAQTFGKLGKSVTDYSSKSSFDFRQTKAANSFTKETGMNLNKGTNILGLDTKKGLGGYAGAQQRKIEKENKFGEALGYDHHKYEELKDEIAKQEGELIKEKRNKIDIENELRNHKSTMPINPVNGTNEEKEAYKVSMKAYNDKLSEISNRLGDKTKEINDLENGSGKDGQIKGINTLKKEQERVKSGRAKEYALTMKRKSGYVYNNVGRDINDNIIKFGHAEKSGAQAAKQIMKEFAKGMAGGALTGAVAGSVVPGIGTLAGAVGGGLVGAVRSTIINYSGTTNRKVGEESHGDKHEVKDNYNPPVASHSAPSSSHGSEEHGGDDHGGGDAHGGGGHETH